MYIVVNLVLSPVHAPPPPSKKKKFRMTATIIVLPLPRFRYFHFRSLLLRHFLSPTQGCGPLPALCASAAPPPKANPLSITIIQEKEKIMAVKNTKQLWCCRIANTLRNSYENAKGPSQKFTSLETVMRRMLRGRRKSSQKPSETKNIRWGGGFEKNSLEASNGLLHTH